MSWHNTNKPDGPPELDKLIMDFLNKLLGDKKKSGGGGNTNNTGSPGGNFGGLTLFIILVLVTAIYVVAGLYTVQTGENALITRFGKYSRTEGPGLHWMPKLIEDKDIVNVQAVSTIRRSSSMLTKDGNILIVPLTIQYLVHDAEKFSYNVVSPEMSLEQISDSALRDVVGHSTLDEVLTTGRTKVVHDTRILIEQIANAYELGISISDVVLEKVETPQKVKDAFNDAIKAKSDEEAIQNKAREYENRVIPEAEGAKARILQEAMAYKQKKVLQAEGEVAKFTKLLPEYKLAPEVTRERIYLQTMEEVLGESSKVLLDVEGSNNLMYLPLDKMISKRGGN